MIQPVTAAIIKKDQKFLIGKRKKGGPQGEKWEFPGGKVEPGETPQQALKRELLEELAIDVKVNDFLGSHFFSNKTQKYELMAYSVDYLSGEIKLNEHTEIKWITPSEWDNYDFAESDAALIKKIFKTDEQN